MSLSDRGVFAADNTAGRGSLNPALAGKAKILSLCSAPLAEDGEEDVQQPLDFG